MTSDSPMIANRHFLCIRCGYDLFQADVEGQCPECGQPIKESYRDDLLAFSDVEWLKRVKGGLDIMFWLIVAGVITVAGYVSLFLVLLEPNLHCFLVVIQIMFGIAFLMTTFRITEKEPTNEEGRRGNTWRVIMRIAAVLWVSGEIVLVSITTDIPCMIHGLVYLAGYSQIIMIFSLLSYASVAAGRIPERSVAGAASLLRWAYLLVVVIGLSLGIHFNIRLTNFPWMNVLPGQPLRLHDMFLMRGSCVIGAFWLASVMAAIGMLIRIRCMMARILPIARTNSTLHNSDPA
jgi:hypothetical protein